MKDEEEEEEEEDEEYAQVPLWKRALMKKKAQEQKMKEANEKLKVRRLCQYVCSMMTFLV